MSAAYTTIAWFRLELGVEPLDALTGQRLLHEVVVAREPLRAGARSRLARRATGLHAQLVDGASPRAAAALRAFRVFEAQDRRRYVPRRLEATLDAAGQLVVRPRLFPGAGCDVPGGATGVRGTVLRRLVADEPATPYRWVRVEARAPGSAEVLARAHGDDRGEFVLLLPPMFPAGRELPAAQDIELVVLGGAELPVSGDDPLSDLPVEATAASDDDVARGLRRPDGYAELALRDVPLDRAPGPAELALRVARVTTTLSLALGQVISKRFVL